MAKKLNFSAYQNAGGMIGSFIGAIAGYIAYQESVMPSTSQEGIVQFLLLLTKPAEWIYNILPLADLNASYPAVQAIFISFITIALLGYSGGQIYTAIVNKKQGGKSK